MQKLIFQQSVIVAAAISLLFAPTLHAGDYNGDGFDDLAFGVDGENLNAALDAGVVHVIYGTANGLRSAGTQIWSQDTAGIPNACELGDYLTAGVSGDFNGDGFDDLILAVPFEDGGSFVNAGAFHVLNGSASGLRAQNTQFWSQDSTGIADAAEAGDFFAGAQAVGDFNNDGFDDLAISASGEDLSTIADTGMVHVLYGSASGLRTLASQLWSQNTPGIADAVQADEFFGAGLASGDFDGDGFADLAIGVPGQTIGGASHAGAVHVLYGTSTGLKSVGSQYWHQAIAGIASLPGAGESFGSVLSAGDFNNDGRDELVIGVVGETVSGQADAGAIHIITGSASGLTALGSRFITRSTVNVLGTAAAGDEFGSALAIGDFDDDSFPDLALSVPRANVGSISNAGAVQVLFGSPTGITVNGNQLWTQNSLGIIDGCEADDQFGDRLRAGDFNGDGKSDLGIRVPLEDISGFNNVGAFAVFYGSGVGLDDVGDQFWQQNSPGILESLEATDAEGF